MPRRAFTHSARQSATRRHKRERRDRTLLDDAGAIASEPADGHAAELLTVVEVAGMLRISRNLAYDLVARGEMPAIRFGRTIRIYRPALTAWLADRPAAILPRS